MEGFFLILLMMQMLSYGIVDYYKIKYGRFTVLSLFLILLLIVFPLHFRIGSEEEKNALISFYNSFAYFKVNWNIGMVLVLSSHFIYCYLINRKLKTAS